MLDEELIDGDDAVSPEMVALVMRGAKTSLKTFAQIFWPVVNPGADMLWNWHLDCIVEHLEAVTRRELKTLMISVPPGSCKSTLVGQMWPTWEWLQHPERRWVFATNALDNAKKEAIYRRSIIQSPLYRKLDPPFASILRTKNILTVRNNKNGVFRGLSTGSSITGDHFDTQVIDDPNDAQRVAADELDMINFWYDNAFSSRKRANCALVLIQQRLAPNDLIGHLLDVVEPDAVINIPMQFEPKHAMQTKIGWKDPRDEEGELMWPERFSEADVMLARRTLGEAAYRAQYQQRPMALGAGVTFRREWWQRWTVPPRDVISWFATVDTASSMRRGADNSVIEIWALARGGIAYLMHLEFGHWDIKTKTDRIIAALDLYPQCRRVAIEERGEGFAVADMLEQALKPSGRDVQRWTSQAPKEARITVCAPLVESGHIVLPEGDAAEAMIDEAAAFPEGDHDDMIDAMAMIASIWMRELTGAAYADDVARGGARGVERLGATAVLRSSNRPDDERIKYGGRRANMGGALPRKAPVWYR